MTKILLYIRFLPFELLFIIFEHSLVTGTPYTIYCHAKLNNWIKYNLLSICATYFTKLKFTMSYLSVEPLQEIENFHAAGPGRPSKGVFLHSKVCSQCKKFQTRDLLRPSILVKRSSQARILKARPTIPNEDPISQTMGQKA